MILLSPKDECDDSAQQVMVSFTDTKVSELMNNTENIYQWMRSSRIYEGYIFGYIAVLTAWGFVGLFTFGFEIDGYTQKENLVFNFFWYLILAFCMALSPSVYRRFKDSKANIESRRKIIAEAMQSIDDEQFRQEIIKHLKEDGGLPPNRLQIWALIGIAWYYLFEMFFSGACVKDLALVWQPDWIISIIAWVKDNTVITPYFTMEGVFSFSFGGHGDGETETIIARMFNGDEQAFLDSAFGEAAIIFHMIKAIGFLPLLGAWMIVMWQLLGWTGMNNLDASQINGIKSFLWLSFISFFMFLMAIAAFGIFVTDLTYTAGPVMGLVYWLRDFWLNILILFTIISVRLTVGWLYFWKNLLMKLR
ncbi:MAG: hypothetical protein KGV50_05475 [Gammaproteobacteria bacterium]|nr:hypothetical protein [Gammaproteobacteria bacterium]